MRTKRVVSTPNSSGSSQQLQSIWSLVFVVANVCIPPQPDEQIATINVGQQSDLTLELALTSHPHSDEVPTD